MPSEKSINDWVFYASKSWELSLCTDSYFILKRCAKNGHAGYGVGCQKKSAQDSLEKSHQAQNRETEKQQQSPGAKADPRPLAARNSQPARGDDIRYVAGDKRPSAD